MKNYESTAVDDETAFNAIRLGSDDVTFGRAIGTMIELAVQTNGVFCPLMGTGPAANVGASYGPGCDDTPTGGEDICTLKDTVRAGVEFETRSQEYLTKGLQAARCAQLALEQNPFILVDPVCVYDSGPGACR